MNEFLTKKVESTHGTPPAAGIASFRSATTKDSIIFESKGCQIDF